MTHIQKVIYIYHINKYLIEMIIYTPSPLIKQLIEYLMSQKTRKCYWRHLYVVCEGQSPSAVQPWTTKGCCDSTQAFDIRAEWKQK